MSETTPAQSLAPRHFDDLRRGTKTYDFLAALPLVVWFAADIVVQLRPIGAELSMLNSSGLQFQPLVWIVSKLSSLLFAALMIGFLIARPPPKAGASGILPRVVAISGTYLGVAIALLPQRSVTPWVLSLSTLLAASGISFAVYSLAWLGRSFSLMPEARRLVTGGPYAVVRHPLYVGEELPIIGFAIQNFSGPVLGLLLLQICCQLCRMHFEERVLQDTFPEYASYKARTYRLIPGIY